MPTSRATRVTSAVKIAELLNHRVDDIGGTQELAFEWTAIDVETNGLCQVALSDGGDCACDFGGGAEQVFHERVDRNFHLAPGTSGLMKAGTFARSAFLADRITDPLSIPAPFARWQQRFR